MRNNKRTEFKRGFTLLEVLIALAVFSIVIMASVRNSSVLSDNSIALKEMTLAHFVAMNKLADLRLSDTTLSLNESRGITSMANIDWQWRVKVKSTSDRNIRKAEINVNRVDGREDPVAHLTAYIGQAL